MTHPIPADKHLWQINGFFGIGLLLLLLMISLALFGSESIVFSIASFVIIALALTGFYINTPNEAVVATLFGSYVGMAGKEGFFITLPFTSKTKVSLKAVNIHTDTIKVNDAKGNPIEISAVVVWKVINPYQAIFGVDNYQHFVKTQADTAIRSIASHYSYDAPDGQTSLRGCTDVIIEQLRGGLQDRLSVAGVQIIEARISHLAYAAEIAQTMLRRQQAEATIAARQYIVENAVEIVERVLTHLEKNKGIILDNKDKLMLINNLLVALVSEHDASPVINLGGR